MRLSEEQTATLLKPIAAHRVKELDGNSYVEQFDIRAMMNRVFGFTGWGLAVTHLELLYEQTTETRAGKPAFKTAYRCSVRLTIYGDPPCHYDGASVGESTMPDFKRGDAHDMALKTAESGALKRAATCLGDQFGLSLYDNGSLYPVVKRVVGYNTAEGQPGWEAVSGAAV
jgi:recombination DNA repair RAD52 pathway protein